MTQEKKQEYTLRITQANKTQMITILLEMVTDYLADAKESFNQGEKEVAFRYLGQAQNCIDELIKSVNRRVELGRIFNEIYIFSKKELILAEVTEDIDKAERVEEIFRNLSNAYRQIEKYDKSAPAMGNTQTVYAGLTYGRHSLNEEVAIGSLNRGYMA